MIDKKVIHINEVQDNLLARLENRDVALWVKGLPANRLEFKKLTDFLGLPWHLVVLEISDTKLIKVLEEPSKSSDYITRKRGFIQIVESDPSRIQFPQRCLPIYLLNGRASDSASNNFDDRLRRITMLEGVRRSLVRELFVISGDCDPLPSHIDDLWSSGFRSNLTFASDFKEANEILEDWVEKTRAIVSLLRLPAANVIENLLVRYFTSYPEDRKIIRVRNFKGDLHKVDITETDDPEQPISEQYSLVLDRDLAPLQPEELSEIEFMSFFQDPNSSWRPYAAGMPWVRDSIWTDKIDNLLNKLNYNGSEENCIAYITSEAGAGGTTAARSIAWSYASKGYPVLFANQIRFVPDSLAIYNFLFRVNKIIQTLFTSETETNMTDDDHAKSKAFENGHHHYEVPWLIVFDRVHWEFRDIELQRFCKDIQNSGRSVLILVITNSLLERSFLDEVPNFKHVGRLDHSLDLDDARQLGNHLNKYLRIFGKQQNQLQWERFYEEHTIRHLHGYAHFWITLSFWIQGQYDMSETIQQWMYDRFKKNTSDNLLREIIFEISAMSSERLPMPEAFLPISDSVWPISHLLEECRTSVPAIGLMPIKDKGVRYWGLVHDILGRFMINALFYDIQTRQALGFADAQSSEHLRFLFLRQISKKAQIGEKAYNTLGEDFAKLVFKIDPDHGRAGFAMYWREVLEALDTMPASLRNTSRVFRHHSAISRRRIAKLNGELYDVSNQDRIMLLEQAIKDLQYALLSIEYIPGSEPDLNLYNSLARAYLDLAEVIESINGTTAQVKELRKLANEATRKAYEESPRNSYVVETYVRNMLGTAKSYPESTIECCIEALGVLFSAISSSEVSYRRSQLGVLADEALDLLLLQVRPKIDDIKPDSPIEILTLAWAALAKNDEFRSVISLSEIPEKNRKDAIEILRNPKGEGNIQIIRLNYQLTCITFTTDFKLQLELIEQLESSDYRINPQQRLEYAILLYQNNRAIEGGKVFHNLRRLWRESEQFVNIPERLRWLRTEDGKERKKVNAVIGSDVGYRAIALVQNFNNQKVPFRPEEFNIRHLRAGGRITCHVSFGHNGPFLRPVTAGPIQVNQQI